MSERAEQFQAVHQMACAAARLIRDGETVIVGIGLPLIAAVIAREEHAPNSTILFEGGAIGTKSRRIPWSIADSATSDYAQACMEVWRVLSDVQAGYIDVGIVGGAQIDRFGNLNSNTIIGQGSYISPQVRMPGSGGSNDIASSCGRTIIMMRLRKENFVDKVDFVTSPGFLEGGDSRRRMGLRGGGPEAVVTDKGIFRFHPETKRMFLSEISSRSSIREIKEFVGWDLEVAADLKSMEAPKELQMEIMARFDPLGIILGPSEEIRLDDFQSYYQAMIKNVLHHNI